MKTENENDAIKLSDASLTFEDLLLALNTASIFQLDGFAFVDIAELCLAAWLAE